MPERREVVPQPHFLTPYQLSQMIVFPNSEPFGAIAGILREDEEQTLIDFSETLLQKRHSVFPGKSFSPFMRIAAETGNYTIAPILDRVSSHIQFEIVTSDDISTPDMFAKLSRGAKFALSRAGTELFAQIEEFMREGGAMTIVQFRKPSPRYLRAIRGTEDGSDSITQKVATALHTPTTEVKEASHEFIHVSFFAPEEEREDPMRPGCSSHFNRILNRRLNDDVEEDIARDVLLRAMLSEEMKGVIISMVGISAALPLLHFLNQEGKDSFLLQSVIKFIPPFLSDVVSFYSQLKPWLEGETPSEEFRDFFQKLRTTHIKSLGASMGTTLLGSSASEVAYEQGGNIPGALIYSLIPLCVAMLTTIDTVALLRKRLQLNTKDTIKEIIKNNPSHVGIDIGAFITFLTGISVLGFAGQFRNPTALTLIEGTEEHSIAALITYLQVTFGSSYKLRAWMDKETEKWARHVMEESQ